MTARTLLLAALSLVWLLASGQRAQAQSDQAVRACLLLRSPAQCGIALDEPYAAPGDLLLLRALRSRPAPRPGASQGFELLRGEFGAETLLEKNRQIFVLPLTWSPHRSVALSAGIPIVRQRLGDSWGAGIGDVSASAAWRFEIARRAPAAGPSKVAPKTAASEPLFSGQVEASIKTATGSQSEGRGTGELDALGLAQIWWHWRRLSVGASAAYRYSGAEHQGNVMQGVLSGEWQQPVWLGLSVAVDAHLLVHHVSEPTPNRAMHLVVGITPDLFGWGFGYVKVLVPLAETTRGTTGVTTHCGLLVPFG